MLIRLISLVFLLTHANNIAFATEINRFIYPEKKPSVFKKIIPKITKQAIIPQNKPIKEKINVENEKFEKTKKN